MPAYRRTRPWHARPSARPTVVLSSRNRRLLPADRARAPRFYAVLSSARTAEDARHELQASGFAVDYVDDRDGRRLGAVRLGGVRLIDNVALGGATCS